jgi:hypothetical protein
MELNGNFSSHSDSGSSRIAYHQMLSKQQQEKLRLIVGAQIYITKKGYDSNLITDDDVELLISMIREVSTNKRLPSLSEPELKSILEEEIDRIANMAG